MDINKETLPLFRKDFSDAVRKLEEKYEVKISLGTITYSENTTRQGTVHCLDFL